MNSGDEARRTTTGEGGNDRAPHADFKPARPIRRGYEQVADQIRDLIQDGLLPPGARLPSEDELARRFGTSRTTVREALRLLAAWNLVRSVVGRRGGTFVSDPDVESITEMIGSNIALLAASRPVSLESLLEVREMLEVPAAGLAAERWTDESLARIASCLIENLSETTAQEQALTDVRFHIAVLEATGNPMLNIAARPVLAVLTDNLRRIPQPKRFREGVHNCHDEIYAAIEARDADAARDATLRHLEELRPYYHRASRQRPHPVRAS